MSHNFGEFQSVMDASKLQQMYDELVALVKLGQNRGTWHERTQNIEKVWYRT